RTGSHPEHIDFSDLDNLDGKVKWTPLEKKGFNLFAKRFSEAEIADITHEGASLLTRRPPEIGEDIFIVLQHDQTTDELLKVQAKVVRHMEGGFAVQLDSPSREVRSWITKMRSFRRLDE
ncbi:MAG: PilZ domain-containing protein, partial [Myxococcota bacterium]